MMKSGTVPLIKSIINKNVALERNTTEFNLIMTWNDLQDVFCFSCHIFLQESALRLIGAF